LTHAYFGRQLGWFVRGLGRHPASILHQARHIKILATKAPGLAQAMQDAGKELYELTFNDTLALMVSIESLIIQHCVDLLRLAYTVMGLEIDSPVDENSQIELITSYFIMFESQNAANDVHGFRALVLEAVAGENELAPLAEMSKTLLRHHTSDVQGRQQQERQEQSFAAMSATAVRGVYAYRNWQDLECQAAKRALTQSDVRSTGRVPLEKFYTHSKTNIYAFTESAAYLRDTGSLDESDPDTPQVVIANYMTLPSNCLSPSSYFSLCCISECEDHMSAIEQAVQNPTSPPEQLLHIVEKLLPATAQRPPPALLQQTAQKIAMQYEGQIPLHSFEFSQWMHMAFPSECPVSNMVTRDQGKPVSVCVGEHVKQPQVGLHRCFDFAHGIEEEVDEFDRNPFDLPVLESEPASVEVKLELVLKVAVLAGVTLGMVHKNLANLRKKCNA